MVYIMNDDMTYVWCMMYDDDDDHDLFNDDDGELMNNERQWGA